MKRIFIGIVLLSLCTLAYSQKPKKKPCAPTLKECPSEGCSAKNTHDPELNKRKNIKSSDQPVTDLTIAATTRS